MRKNRRDVKVLETMIKEQNGRGASLPTDLDDDRFYEWNKDGRLTDLTLSGRGLSGTLSLAGLDMLKYLDCSDNQIELLDVSHNPALWYLSCSNNRMGVFDVSANPLLQHLDCDGNQLAVLDVSRNPKLECLYCEDNELESLDVSNNPVLKTLFCSRCRLTQLVTADTPVLSVRVQRLEEREYPAEMEEADYGNE